ncbi:hypothetical protein HDU96_000563 [Phlyctochytrium bullatum]|nr:hypothetical protein HDU96_000563 [Phlyctochytrium bullatum]
MIHHADDDGDGDLLLQTGSNTAASADSLLTASTTTLTLNEHDNQNGYELPATPLRSLKDVDAAIAMAEASARRTVAKRRSLGLLKALCENLDRAYDPRHAAALEASLFIGGGSAGDGEAMAMDDAASMMGRPPSSLGGGSMTSERPFSSQSVHFAEGNEGYPDHGFPQQQQQQQHHAVTMMHHRNEQLELMQGAIRTLATTQQQLSAMLLDLTTLVAAASSSPASLPPQQHHYHSSFNTPEPTPNDVPLPWPPSNHHHHHSNRHVTPYPDNAQPPPSPHYTLYSHQAGPIIPIVGPATATGFRSDWTPQHARIGSAPGPVPPPPRHQRPTTSLDVRRKSASSGWGAWGEVSSHHHHHLASPPGSPLPRAEMTTRRTHRRPASVCLPSGGAGQGWWSSTSAEVDRAGTPPPPSATSSTGQRTLSGRWSMSTLVDREERGMGAGEKAWMGAAEGLLSPPLSPGSGSAESELPTGARDEEEDGRLADAEDAGDRARRRGPGNQKLRVRIPTPDGELFEPQEVDGDADAHVACTFCRDPDACRCASHTSSAAPLSSASRYGGLPFFDGLRAPSRGATPGLGAAMDDGETEETEKDLGRIFKLVEGLLNEAQEAIMEPVASLPASPKMGAADVAEEQMAGVGASSSVWREVDEVLAALSDDEVEDGSGMMSDEDDESWASASQRTASPDLASSRASPVPVVLRGGIGVVSRPGAAPTDVKGRDHEDVDVEKVAEATKPQAGTKYPATGVAKPPRRRPGTKSVLPARTVAGSRMRGSKSSKSSKKPRAPVASRSAAVVVEVKEDPEWEDLPAGTVSPVPPPAFAAGSPATRAKAFSPPPPLSPSSWANAFSSLESVIGAARMRSPSPLAVVVPPSRLPLPSPFRARSPVRRVSVVSVVGGAAAGETRKKEVVVSEMSTQTEAEEEARAPQVVVEEVEKLVPLQVAVVASPTPVEPATVPATAEMAKKEVSVAAISTQTEAEDLPDALGVSAAEHVAKEFAAPAPVQAPVVMVVFPGGRRTCEVSDPARKRGSLTVAAQGDEPWADEDPEGFQVYVPPRVRVLAGAEGRMELVPTAKALARAALGKVVRILRRE